MIFYKNILNKTVKMRSTKIGGVEKWGQRY
jgi:hypothetical protein